MILCQKIKSLWGGTDKRIRASEEKLDNLLRLHEKAKEVQKIKQEYRESISKKLDM